MARMMKMFMIGDIYHGPAGHTVRGGAWFTRRNLWRRVPEHQLKGEVMVTITTARMVIVKMISVVKTNHDEEILTKTIISIDEVAVLLYQRIVSTLTKEI